MDKSKTFKIIMTTIATLMLSQAAFAQCGEYYECEEPAAEYDSDDIEASVEAVIDDAFGHCVKLVQPKERLGCYDAAMMNFGYKISISN